MVNASPSIHIDPARVIDEVDPRIYSGFTEHMGRCIYGGIYDPHNEHGLADPQTGFRLDVLEVLRDLKIPLVRYPGGYVVTTMRDGGCDISGDRNFVSSYRWQDGIGPKELRPRRPELAWLTEESNQFGTDEFIAWCRTLGTEPFICLNMGTGTLEDALAWVEYCNSSANTYYANLRRKNGHEEPYGVKYWALGNEMWGPWQVGQMESQDYAKKAFQWAKALKLLDPSIKLISCGETGFADWDRVTLRKLAPVVDFHSVHLYTVSQGKHLVNVMGPAAAEKGIEITRSLIDLAKIESGLKKDLTICFDEWNVWDPVRAPGEKGAEEHYDLSDALAVASWLNVFVRKADIVKIACIAQSVNVISPIITSPTGLFRQTTYYPLHLFSNLMRGSSLDVHVTIPRPDAVYTGPTVPSFVQDLTVHTPDSAKLTKYVDVSAVLASKDDRREIRVAIVNRSDTESFKVPILFGPNAVVASSIRVHELWSADLKASNGFEEEKVKTVVRDEEFLGTYTLKKHSFQVLAFTLL
ncbi:putative glycoside hydrolase family 51 protein [Lyophyllum shimeji]|uniref:non-reducing end alpha-L-arabinofuranosidase n=1 Tax=Lyophyllum shimeji TaxID=47721 RepID=A0A9P3UT10_LYOSH|nr:putative glycoside hydrolase family 51 protein [Lyophyllum shimeji]